MIAQPEGDGPNDENDEWVDLANIKPVEETPSP
jgi:hypothetical protein